jgi:hypothetical protein
VVSESKAQCVADLKETEKITIVVVYRHPHHIEKQQSSRQGCEHKNIYAQGRNQKGNQYRGAWRPTNTIGRHEAREPSPWKHRHEVAQVQGGKAVVGHPIRLPLGWMDVRTW